jgi:hypothetical protein
LPYRCSNHGMRMARSAANPNMTSACIIDTAAVAENGGGTGKGGT